MNVDFLKDVALAVAQEQHLETVMKMIVEQAKTGPDGALRVNESWPVAAREWRGDSKC